MGLSVRRQIAEFENSFRILVPIVPVWTLPVSGNAVGFHHRAALETFSFLEALGIESATLWVTVTVRDRRDDGLAAPERCACMI